MKLVSRVLIIIFFLISCKLENVKNISENILTKKTESKNEDELNEIKDKKVTVLQPKKETVLQLKKETVILPKKETLLYLLGEPYFIEGVKYIPEENYSYSEKGLASYYNKELHNIKTVNNEYNKVTELLGRHKTLPIPSIVKITNLENGLSLIIRINDRHNDITSIIQVSRKVAQLLRFYKNKIARVKVEIQSDASKQIKIVTQSMSDPSFDKTITAVPTIAVIESDLLGSDNTEKLSENYVQQPIELIMEEVIEQDLYVKVYGFKSYNEVKKIIDVLKIDSKTTTEKDGDIYNVLLGPIENIDANKLVSSFISKGYKKTEIILE